MLLGLITLRAGVTISFSHDLMSGNPGLGSDIAEQEINRVLHSATQEICTWFVLILCFVIGLVQASITHIPRGNFTGTGAII